MKLKFLLFLVLAFFVTCNPNRVYHKKHTFSNYKWYTEQKVTFKPAFGEEDIVKKHQIQFNIRYIYGYSYQYLNLLINITRPDGSQAEKEESIQIRKENGDYIGDGAGSYWDLDYNIKDPFSFDQTGEYIIEIVPITEKDPVYFINELGLSILTIK